jgi:hypothetical protein
MEYQGGTFITQIVATDPAKAKLAWLDRIDAENPAQMSSDDRSELREETLDQGVQPLDDTQNVWCFSASIADGFVLVNFVKTAIE